MARFAVILPAAGRSTRFGDPNEKKIHAGLDGRAVWLRAVDPFVRRDDVGQIIIAIHPDDREVFERRYRAEVAFLNIQVIEGGPERHETVAMALDAVDPSCDFVAVHDAARPCLTNDLVASVFAAAVAHGAAIPAVAVADTLKRVGPGGSIVETVPRLGLHGAQTPQVFRRDLIARAYAARAHLGPAITDDATLVEALGHEVRVVPGSPENLKITTPADLRLALAILRARDADRPMPAVRPFAEEDEDR